MSSVQKSQALKTLNQLKLSAFRDGFKGRPPKFRHGIYYRHYMNGYRRRQVDVQ